MKSFISISTISLSLPILWIIATFISSNKLPTGIARSQDPEILMSLPNYILGWIDFIRNTNAVDQIAKNFVGWIGWMAGGKFEIVQIPPTHFVVIAIISSALLLLSLYWMINKIVNQNHKIINMGAITALIISIICYQAITQHISIASFFYTSMAVTLLVAPIAFFYSPEKKEKIITGALVSSLIFTTLLFQKLFDTYLGRGVPGALHGRYFFPLIPLFIIGIAYPSFKILKKHGRYWLFIPMPIILLFIELSFYLERVMPFFLTKIHYLQ